MAKKDNDNIEERDEEFDASNDDANLENVTQVSGMYQNWFLDYASYVILERAVPHINDGLKPVQRRILHSLKEMDDGRYNKVANVIGNTMKYHPHGDASIGDALVQIGQKELAIDCQGNWGNIYTGDSAAAPRYIEARLNKFANEVIFNPKTTEWQLSYDGRNKEPITLPIKFPLLLAMGVEGIAVGLACKILPHNFIELIDGCINILKGKKVTIYPDFPTGGYADFENYNDGLRGGRIKVRAKIEKLDKKTLAITQIPFGTTTSSLIDSILKANDKGKIKIKKIEDNTAEHVEIQIHLTPGVSPDKTIDALYAFTDCESSISPNACVIMDDKPLFLGVSEILKHNANHTRELLKRELEIKLGELQEAWHFASLEKIFIEKRIYRDIEECETWEEVITAIDKGMHKYISTPSRKSKAKGVLQLKRDLTEEDLARLTEIKIKRISKFDAKKADDYIAKLETDMKEVKGNLDTITDYTIEYFKNLKKTYGEGKERKTEIRTFDSIDAAKVAVSNVKLYVNKEEGFLGHGLKRDEGEFVCDCSDIDDIIVFKKDGSMVVTKIDRKTFVGKGIIHVGVWKKGDKRTIYNMIYRDGKAGKSMIKRFNVTSITRDKPYDLTKGTAGSEVLWFTANPNGEAEVVNVLLKPKKNIRKLKFDFDFSELAIKGRNAAGNTLTKYPILKISLKEKGLSTLGARKIWWDDTVRRLNGEERGTLLGDFKAEDKILTIMKSGHYQLTGFDFSTKFEDDLIVIEKWNPEKPISAIYFDGEKKEYYVKRFMVEETDKLVSFISESEDSTLEFVTTDYMPMVQVNFSKVKGKERDPEEINLFEFIAVKGLKAQGNKLSQYKVKSIDALESIEVEPPQSETEESEEEVIEDEANEDIEDIVDDVEDDTEDEEQEEEKPKTKKKASKKSSKASDETPVEVEWEISSPKKGKKKKAKPGSEDKSQISLF
jgi:topoisomerase-4 subunit A